MKTLPLASLLALAFPTVPLAARPLTPDDLVMLSRVSEPALSPDGRWLVWQQRETDLAVNKGRFDLWRLDLAQADTKPEPFTAEPQTDEGSPAFSPDGAFVYYLSDRGGEGVEVWRMPIAGGEPDQVTATGKGIAGFKLSPAGDRLLVWADRPLGAASLAVSKPRAGEGSGRVHDKLFVRHWDSWADGQRSQLFVLPLANGKASGDGIPLVGKLEGDTPSKPFGGGEEIAWSADGKTVYFALREAGRIEATSTNLDIFAARADGSTPPVNLTAANKATDNFPAASPDGQWLAWAAMKRPTYEADRMVVYLRDLKSGAVHALTEGWDRSVESINWAPDSRSLYVTARDHFDRPIFRVDLAGKVTRLTGGGSVSAVVPVAGRLVYALDSLTAPTDLFELDPNGKSRRLTSVNAAKLSAVDMPEAIRFSFAGAGGDTLWGYALKPAGLAAGTKAPIAYLIHGGPQSTFGNGWSYRWNPAVFAGAGYGTVLVDFHGSVGYGQAFTDAINRDWGGKPLEDLKRGLAFATARDAQLDANNACALGASYGGYMTNWIAGRWSDRFKCLVTHAGVFEARSMAYETEELWFDEWEHGGPYYEQAAQYERWNPANYVAAWKTPMLVIHGEKDFRIPYTQGLAAFTLLQRREIPSRLLIFPDENHWVLKPQNSLQWHREVLGWLGRWTGTR
jgi:dipeptidyl aminopeptidase/acylaminoacyl peptidase